MSISNYSGLFNVEEAFVRVGQLREKGCLLIFNTEEAVHLFVDDGNVVHATARRNMGQLAIEQALALEGASFEWLPGVESAKRTVRVSIHEYAIRNSIARDTKVGKTGALPMSAHEKPAKPAFRYFFVPEGAPHVKLMLEKVTNVAGRDPICDLCLVNTQVSRRHCVLQVTDRGLLVKDLDSTNGTYVNGIAVMDGYVSAGDKLSFGAYTLKVGRE